MSDFLGQISGGVRVRILEVRSTSRLYSDPLITSHLKL